MAHDHQDLLRIQARRQGIPEHDALGPEESAHVGVDGARVRALAHCEYAPAVDTGTLGQRQVRQVTASGGLGPTTGA
jgi:hypothetical protein